jgi:hypothetical protein
VTNANASGLAFDLNAQLAAATGRYSGGHFSRQPAGSYREIHNPELRNVGHQGLGYRHVGGVLKVLRQRSRIG